MEEDEIKVDEPIVEDDKIIEEEVEDVEIDDTPTLEDFEKAQKAIKTLKAQKEHWKIKFDKAVTQVKPEDKKEEKKPVESKKLNTEQISSSEIVEMSRLAARGYTDEEMELLKDIKNLKGLNNLTEAIESPLFKANKEQKELEAKKAKAQLPPSGRSSIFKEGQEPTIEDLKNAWLGKK